jgi:hypothetical protein
MEIPDSGSRLPCPKRFESPEIERAEQRSENFLVFSRPSAAERPSQAVTHSCILSLSEKTAFSLPISCAPSASIAARSRD